MSAPRVLMRCDAGPALGSGHVTRCLALARALAERGAAPCFAASAGTFATVPAFAAADFPAVVLERPLDPDGLSAAGPGWDAVVVDHYSLDARHEAAFRRLARMVLAIDDLADRPHDCDILVDQTAGRAPADYAGLVPPGAELHLGPAWALLRPDFAAARPAALAARAAAGPVGRVFLSLGMTDLGGITARAARAALAAGLDAEIAVAVGSRAESLPELRAMAAADPRLALHPDCAEVAALMAASDVAIGAGGMTSWERCCLGLPTLLMVLAPNQETIVRTLAHLGAAEIVPAGDGAALEAALRRLASDAEARRTMSRAAGALVDGLGAARLADAILARIGTRGEVA